MPLQKTIGISLRKRHYSNTSQVVTFLTPHHGKVSVLAKGSKRPRTPFGGPFDVAVLYDIVFADRRSGLQILTEATLLDSFGPARRTYRSMARTSAILELLLASSQPGQSSPELFNLAVDALRAITADGFQEALLPGFEAKLLDVLGVFPELQRCALCGAHPVGRQFSLSLSNGGLACPSCRASAGLVVPVSPDVLSLLARLQTLPLNKTGRLRIPHNRIRELGRLLSQMVSYALEMEIRSFTLSQPGVVSAK